MMSIQVSPSLIPNPDEISLTSALVDRDAYLVDIEAVASAEYTVN